MRLVLRNGHGRPRQRPGHPLLGRARRRRSAVIRLNPGAASDRCNPATFAERYDRGRLHERAHNLRVAGEQITGYVRDRNDVGLCALRNYNSSRALVVIADCHSYPITLPEAAARTVTSQVAEAPGASVGSGAKVTRLPATLAVVGP